MLVYLGICAVLAFVAAAVAAFAAVPPAPTLHVAFAVGAMPLVFGAVAHFVPVLTRSGPPPAAIHWLPPLVQLAGLTVVLALAGALPPWTQHAAATTAVLAAASMAGWIVRRLFTALGTPHPGARWYAAAMLALLLAAGCVPLWLVYPELRAPLRLVHLHLNTLGFIGLAALGTLPVLLPTALGRPEPAAAARLKSDLWPAAAGALLTATGAAAIRPLAAVGALLLGAVALRNLLAWRRAFGWRSIVGDGATAPLAAATLGLVLLSVQGLTHGAGLVAARPALAAWAAGFLLPLVTGALTQLLPVWRHPGPATPARVAMRARLAAGGRLRAALCLAGSLALALDQAVGAMPVALALGWFVLALMRALAGRRAGATGEGPL